MKKISIVVLVALFVQAIVLGQSTPKIKIDGITTSADPVNGIKLPYWLNAAQTLAADQDVNAISVLEFTVNGTNLDFSQVKNVTTVQSVPAGKVWKIESIGFSSSTGAPTNWTITGNSATTPGVNFIGNTDPKDLVVKTDNIERMRVTSSGNVGVGTVSPAAKLEVAGQVKITGGTPGANKVLTSDASGLASWNTFTGKVVNVTFRTNSTRQVLGTGSASLQLESFIVDKKSATSILYVDGVMSGFGQQNCCIPNGWKYGAATEVIAQTHEQPGPGASCTVATKAVISGYATTGPQTLTMRFFSANGTTNSPFIVYNPNTSDDARTTQTTSVYVVWEIEP